MKTPEGRDDLVALSARERQIMETLLAAGKATVTEIRSELPDPPNPSAIRTMLLRLEDKGLVRASKAGRRNVYSATINRDAAGARALERLIATYFGGSPIRTVAAILEKEEAQLSDRELERLERLVAEARKREESG